MFVLAVAVVTAAATARLGFWQLDRARQKEALTEAIQARAVLPALQAEELTMIPPEQAHHRVASVQGRWMPEHTVFLENRPMNGQAGFWVLTPLRLSGDHAVLVQRGWQPRDLRDRTLTQPVPSPADHDVRVRARVAPPPSRLMEFDSAATGAIRQNVDIASLRQEWGLNLLPLSLIQLEPALACSGQTAECGDVLQDGLRRDWAVVAATAQKNRGYAVQWFALSALVVGLTVWFQFLRPRRSDSSSTP